MTDALMPKVHDLKTLPEYFAAVLDGIKTFEVRADDRGFAVGDTLLLREWSFVDGYSGRECTRIVSYIMRGPPFAREGYATLAIKPQPGKAEGEDVNNRAQAIFDTIAARDWLPVGGDARLGFFHAILDGLTAKLDQDGERIAPVEPGRGGEAPNTHYQ